MRFRKEQLIKEIPNLKRLNHNLIQDKSVFPVIEKSVCFSKKKGNILQLGIDKASELKYFCFGTCQQYSTSFFPDLKSTQHRKVSKKTPSVSLLAKSRLMFSSITIWLFHTHILCMIIRRSLFFWPYRPPLQQLSKLHLNHCGYLTLTSKRPLVV